jgi:hypothetical protein
VLLGSDAEQVLRISPVPVLLVNAHQADEEANRAAVTRETAEV